MRRPANMVHTFLSLSFRPCHRAAWPRTGDAYGVGDLVGENQVALVDPFEIYSPLRSSRSGLGLLMVRDYSGTERSKGPGPKFQGPRPTRNHVRRIQNPRDMSIPWEPHNHSMPHSAHASILECINTASPFTLSLETGRRKREEIDSGGISEL
jgi:hypothetical protein